MSEEGGGLASSMDELIKNHEDEGRGLDFKIKELLKSCKKGKQSQIMEAQVIQMRFDLKAKHRDEINELEERMESLGVHVDVETSSSSVSKNNKADDDKSDEVTKLALEKSKIEKAKRKKDKRQLKENDRQLEREAIHANSGPSARETELQAIVQKLTTDGFSVKVIISDGNCLYRAISDQLGLYSSLRHLDHNELRKIAAQNIREKSAEYCPFLELSPDEPAFEEYCQRVESSSASEWGGQVEIRAISMGLKVPISIYSASAPVLTVGEEFLLEPNSPVIRLTYHECYYALGQHYNSAFPTPKS